MFQGAGGGPSEDNVTGFLAYSLGTDLSQKGGVVAIDAGTHLSAIVRILECYFPLVAPLSRPQSTLEATASAPSPGGDAVSTCADSDSDGSDETEAPVINVLSDGPFAGFQFPHLSARANAVHFVREHVEAYLITHPHLDHLSGFAMNTAAFTNTSRPKRLTALASIIKAVKTHIFNDIIWPNLTDEDDGVGLVTFQRLTEGGNLQLGDGHSRGFIEVCNGIAVKAFRISNGNCISPPKLMPEAMTRRGSGANVLTQSHSHHGNLYMDNGRRLSSFGLGSQPGTPTFHGQTDPAQGVVESTAFFVRADASGREVLIFGDVEPDSISAFPRTRLVWAEAAPKIASGHLAGIFIECSYTDAQKDAVLFGHLAPRHLIAELQVLSGFITDAKKELQDKNGKKRKRLLTLGGGSERSRKVASEHSVISEVAPNYPPSQMDGVSKDEGSPLAGIRVIIIHVKDSMMDGPLVGDQILAELNAHEDKLRIQGKGLGCVFEISKGGDSYLF